MHPPWQFAELLYRKGMAPWDIGGPQEPIKQLAASGAITGRVLDSGCGTGWHAIELARAGCEVVGIDAAPTAIAQARRNAQTARVAIDFQLGDVTTLDDGYKSQFNAVIDSKCFDNLADTDSRRRYAKALHHATQPGSRWFIYSFGPGVINGYPNPDFLTEADFRAVLPAAGWKITYVAPMIYQLRYRRRRGNTWRSIAMLEVHAERQP